MCGLSIGSRSIVKVNVKVMQILTAKFLKLIKDGQTLLFPSNWKLCIGFRLRYLRLKLTHFKDQGHGHANFDTLNILVIVKENNYYFYEIASHYEISICMFRVDLDSL